MKYVRPLASRRSTAKLIALSALGSFAVLACSAGEHADATASALKCAADDWSCQDGTTGDDDGTPAETITCYRDYDKDGAGDPNTPADFTSACGTGYVANDGDCNDKDAKVKTLYCYADKDKDGTGGGSSIKVCAASCTDKGYVSKGGDCNDSDAAWQGTKCFTDNDRDGVGATLEAALYCGSKTSCPAGFSTKSGDCSSTAISNACFEKTGTTSLYLSNFQMVLQPNSGGDAITSSGGADHLSQSKVAGTMAADGTFSFTSSNFVVKEIHNETVAIYGDLVVTTTIAATADFSAKVTPGTGVFNTFQVPAKVSINVRKASDTGKGYTCSETAVSIKMTSSDSAPYNSSNGSFTLVTSESFAVDAMSGNSSVLCGAINSYLPATGTLSINAQALDPRPIASWPALATYNPGTAK